MWEQQLWLRLLIFLHKELGQSFTGRCKRGFCSAPSPVLQTCANRSPCRREAGASFPAGPPDGRNARKKALSRTKTPAGQAIFPFPAPVAENRTCHAAAVDATERPGRRIPPPAAGGKAPLSGTRIKTEREPGRERDGSGKKPGEGEAAARKRVFGGLAARCEAGFAAKRLPWRRIFSPVRRISRAGGSLLAGRLPCAACLPP